MFHLNMWNIDFFIVIVLLSVIVSCENKYSEESNKLQNIHNLKDPLRMGKLNVIWEKARRQLSDSKLRKFLSELKVLDTEELTLKKLKSSGGDKDGLKEASLRKKLSDTLKRYGLGHNLNEDDLKKDQKLQKSLFKDKKLHKLWLKAEQSGLTQEELKALKEEFQHHQDKIDEYYTLIEQASSQNDVTSEVLSNDIHLNDFDEMEGTFDDYAKSANAIREKHRELKQGYDHLHRKATSGPDSKEFVNSKVSGLWKLALRSNFDDLELESLYTELKHYETRLQKLAYLDNEAKKVNLEKFDDELSEEDKEKILKAQGTEGQRILQDRLEKQIRKTNKLHEHLESRILARHSEL